MAPLCTSRGLPAPWSCIGSSHEPSRISHRLPAREWASKGQLAPFLCCQASESSSSYGSGAGSSRTERSRQRDVLREELAQRSRLLPALIQEIADTMISNGPKGAVRALQAATAVVEVGQEYVASVQRGAPQAPPVVLRKLFTRLGSTYIKLGQFVASSPTLFPPEYVLEMQQCLDSAPPVAWDVIKRTIESELAGSLEQTFSYVNPVAMATASVAQVHEAVLRASNKEVVIKVLKPGVEDVLSTDLSFLVLTVKILQFINPELERASLVDIVGDIRDAMTDEVDFVKEARNIGDFQSYVERSGLSSVATSPFVYSQHSSRRVLVMEKLRGVPLTDLGAIRSITRAEPTEVLVAALNTWFGSVMGANTFHADVHAGNLLVLEDGRVGFIDFGIVGRINPVIWQALQAAMLATATSDFDMLARALATVGATSSDVDIQAFAADLQRLFTEIETLDPEMIVDVSRGAVTASAVVADESLNRILLQLVSVADTHGVRFPRVFGILIKQALYFDRYTKILAPEMSVMSDERLIFRDAMKY